MRWLVLLLPFAVPAAAAFACNDGQAFTTTDLAPQIVTASGPKGGVVSCDPSSDAGADADAGAKCPVAISVTFRLPKDQFVTKALVRFQGDGSDTGVDRAYPLPQTNGNDSADVVVNILAGVPPAIFRRGALYTYNVRLVTGIGKESTPSTLTVSVQ